MISYNYINKTYVVTEILCVSWKVANNKRCKSFIVCKDDGKLGQPQTLNIDGKQISAEKYEIGEWADVGDKND